MRPKSGRKRGALVGACTAMLLIVGGVAYAHYVYEEGYVWEGDHKCLKGRAEISHGENDGGYAKTDVRGVNRVQGPNNSWGADCWDDWNRPPNTYAAQNILAKWSEKHDQWALCVDGQWKYNTSTGHDLTKVSVYRLKCGPGWYANYGGAYTYISPDWVGYHIYSGHDYLNGE